MEKTKTRVKKFRWFWPWQDEAEENWLEKMSQKGYHLSSVSLPGFYTFSVAEPRKYIYRLDYQTFYKKDKGEYLQLFQDAGWEYIGELSAWQYFRKEVKQGETTEIYTDVESKIAKYKRVLGFLWFFWMVLLVFFGGRILTDAPYPWWGAVQVIFLLVILLYTYAIIRLAVRIRQLRKL